MGEQSLTQSQCRTPLHCSCSTRVLPVSTVSGSSSGTAHRLMTDPTRGCELIASVGGAEGVKRLSQLAEWSHTDSQPWLVVRWVSGPGQWSVVTVVASLTRSAALQVSET